MRNIPSSEITSERVYLGRREFLAGLAAVVLPSAAQTADEWTDYTTITTYNN